MEKKKLQRIIGILVVVALVIVLIPLLFNKKDTPPPAQKVTALIAPEQQSSSAAAPESSSGTIAQNNASNSAVSSTNTTNTTTATASTNTVNSNEQDEDNGITPIASIESSIQNNTPATPTNSADANNVPVSSTEAHSVVPDTGATNNPSSAAASANNTSQQPATQNFHSNVKYTGNTVEVTPVPVDSNAPAQNTEEITPAVATAVNDTVYPQAKVEKTAAINTPATKKEVKPRHTHESVIAKKTSSFSEKDLANLKKPAWVVQMGSFKDKSNAHRLVDQLRTAGFKAFTHEVTSSTGTVRTRVYIGPEFKEASALKLSTQVEQAVKLRGFVVPYKPLAL